MTTDTIDPTTAQTTNDPRLPTLPWCEDCWRLAGEPDGPLPDACPTCGSDGVFRL